MNRPDFRERPRIAARGVDGEGASSLSGSVTVRWELGGETNRESKREMGSELAAAEAAPARPLRGAPRTGMATKRPERELLRLSSGLPLRRELSGSILSRSPSTGAL